jgi:hypothetical protein
MVNLFSNLGEMAVTVMPLAGGDTGVEQTVRQMRRLIDQGKKDPVIRELAANIIRAAGVPAFDFVGESRAVYDWVRHHIRFTRDVYNVETLQSAREIVRLSIGDCDDFTVLICSLLGTIGHKARIVTISKPEDEKHFSHVFPQDCLNGAWITLDAARLNPAFGRDPENVDRVRLWSVTKDDHQDVQGLLNGPRLAGPAGRNPKALPGAYAPWVADPRYRNFRGHTVRGTGRYGRHEVRKALSGMGLGDIDWSDVSQAVSSATTGAANIIAATRANPYNLYPTTSTAQNATALQNPLLAQQMLLAQQQQQTFGGIPTSTLLLGALGLGAVVLLAGRH